MSDAATGAGESVVNRARSWFVGLRYSRFFKAMVAAQLVAAATILVHSLGWLQSLELDMYDWLRVATAGHQKSDRILLVGIDETDYQRWRYPLSDGDLAALLERIAEWEPRAIAVDLFRDTPVPPGSERLSEVLARHPNIVWAYKLNTSGDRGIPAPEWVRGSQRAVFGDIPADRGNTVRRGLLYAEDGVENQTGLGMALALRYLVADGIRPGPKSHDRLRLGKAVIAPIEDTRGPYVAPDGGGYQILLDFHGGPDAFRRVSLADVMERDGISQLVRGRCVIIGNIAESVHDTFTTPFDSWFGGDRQVYGITIHAHLADQLLRAALGEARDLRALSPSAEMLWIWCWTMAGALLGLFLPSLLWTASALVIGLALLAGGVWMAFTAALWLPGPPAGLGWVGMVGLSNRVRNFKHHWRERYPLAGRRQGRRAPPPTEMPDGAIFISYAREDLPTVRTLKNSLEAAGLTVWFDFDRIGAGDSFDSKIHDNIQHCSLFLPVLSYNTEARSEGFFRREWRYALDREMGFAPGVPFIIPVAVDNLARFEKLPPRFRELHITELPEGHVTTEFLGRLKQIQQQTDAEKSAQRSG